MVTQTKSKDWADPDPRANPDPRERDVYGYIYHCKGGGVYKAWIDLETKGDRRNVWRYTLYTQSLENNGMPVEQSWGRFGIYQLAYDYGFTRLHALVHSDPDTVISRVIPDRRLRSHGLEPFSYN